MAASEEYLEYFNSQAKNVGYFDWYTYTKLVSLKYLSKLLYKESDSRVIYANRSVAFRKRLEMLQNGIKEDASLTTLDFPFTSFFVDKGIKTLENKFRYGTAFCGTYNELYGRYLHFQPNTIDFQVTCYFDNEHDYTFAQNVLLWEKNAGCCHVAYTVNFRGKELEIPLQITIPNDIVSTTAPEDLTATPMYFITFAIQVETVSFMVNYNQDSAKLPLAYNTEDDWTEAAEDGPIAEKVILDFANVCLKYDVQAESTSTGTEETGEYDVEKKDTTTDVDVVSSSLAKVATYATISDRTITGFKEAYYDAAQSTYDTATSNYKACIVVTPHADLASAVGVNLVLPSGKLVNVMSDINNNGKVFIDGLKKNSTYQIAFSAIDTSKHVIKLLNLTFSTPADEPVLNANTETAKTPEQSSYHRISKLVGSVV